MQMMVSAGLIAIVVLWGLISPSSLGVFFNGALASVTKNFGWLYLWVVLALVVLALFLALSKYGNLHIGGEDDEPEFSLASWFSMLFAAGMGIGLVYWGVAEPLAHYASPPPGVAPKTAEAANAAMRYSFFHWGLHPWAIYGIVALSIAYFQFKHGAKALISASIETLPWAFVRRLAPVFNVMAIVATAFGVATSLGLGAAQINSGLFNMFGLSVSTAAQVGIIIVVTFLFVFSAVTGLEKGVKYLSQINLIFALLLMLLVFFAGPTVIIIETFTNTLGSYLSEVVRMSLRLTPFRDSNNWVGSWTIFYWAWWIAWSPFVGLFIARISRGRTVREFLIGVVIAPTLLGFLWFSIFGGSAVYHDVLGGNIAASSSSQALFDLLATLPMSGVTAFLATVLVVVFFVTSGDSATFVLATMSNDGNPMPSNRTKIIWGGLISGIALSLLLAGGLNAVQTATIVFALPFSCVLILMAVALVRAMVSDYHDMEVHDRELRKKLEKIRLDD